MTLLTFMQQAANEPAIHKQSSVVEEVEDLRVRANFEELWQWCDSNPDLEQGSLDALAKASDADAIDTHFVVRLVDELWEDGAWIDGVKDAARQARQRAHLARRTPLTDEQKEAVQAYADRAFPPSATFDRPDVGSHVQIIRDRTHTCPGGGTDAFLRDYLRELPPGWRDSLVLDLKAGEHPVICRWTPTREKISATRAWCRTYRHRDEPRFEALESHWFEGERVVIPAATTRPAVTIEELTKPRRAAPPAAVSPTGLEPLDAVLATRGIPEGARVVVQAATAQGKTALMLELAEAWAVRGPRVVVWVATADEPRESVMARRRQRQGMARAEAIVSTDDSNLEPRLLVVDGRDHTIEEVLALSPAPALLVLDPVSKVRTEADAADPVVRVGHVLDLVEAAGWTTLMSAPVVRGAKKRTAAERALGGARIEAGATMLLELTRAGDDVTIGIIKSRLGGEGMEVALRLDREGQRLVPVEGAARGSGAAGAVHVEERVWADVQRLLAERGPLSARALTDNITGKAATIRAVVRERLDAGALLEVDGKVRLP